ncbi:hypothetical protein DPMN_116400 [Dreissena polymorpha]|uniref:Uncharacterized protein n=1 Tax=Dreissena polymorpha TaxID=45954 RepID=A0A9D4QTD5_DREPO|nr:hypothetical protein DPMN_116400 [Dreissena polymorpha]
MLPDCGLLSEDRFIPKEEDFKTLKQLWTNSLLNVEGNMFLSIQATRITNYT